MTDFNDKQYNGAALLGELIAAGINPTDVRVQTNGRDFNLRVDILVEDTDSAIEDTINAVATAHDATVLSRSETIEQVASSAKTDIENIPNWARWDAQQSVDYIDNNVTDLASAKVVLKAMARMLVALRNKAYPDLQD